MWWMKSSTGIIFDCLVSPFFSSYLTTWVFLPMRTSSSPALMGCSFPLSSVASSLKYLWLLGLGLWDLLGLFLSIIGGLVCWLSLLAIYWVENLFLANIGSSEEHEDSDDDEGTSTLSSESDSVPRFNGLLYCRGSFWVMTILLYWLFLLLFNGVNGSTGYGLGFYWCNTWVG